MSETKKAVKTEVKKPTVSAAVRSARMKKAWETRRARMGKVSGGAPSKPVLVQIPPKSIQTKVDVIMSEQFFRYLDFAITNRDSGVLSTEKFNTILANVRPLLTVKN